MPHETAAISAQVLCTPYNHAPCHFMQSHIRKVCACLALTCHLRFLAEWPGSFTCYCGNTGVEQIPNKSQHRKSTLEKKILPPLLQGFEPWPFSHESVALTTELSPPPQSCLTFGFGEHVLSLCASNSSTLKSSICWLKSAGCKPFRMCLLLSAPDPVSMGK